MGTTYHVKLAKPPTSPAELKKDIDTLLKEINLKMSTYIPESELSLFNQSDSTDWLPISLETLGVIVKAVEVHTKSAGAFDVTVGPLVNLWGFGPGKRTTNVPEQSAINAAMRHSGLKLVEIDTTNKKIKKHDKEVELDLSAIAKGYGVDQVASLLQERGIENFLVEIGGELTAKGLKHKGQPWLVAVERADDSAQQAQHLLAVHNFALATSGSYRNYFENNGVRYSHTISPNTGRPITHTLVSVSVAADNCMTADAWATALMVLGPTEGLATAERNNIAALFIEKQISTFTEKASSQWNLLLP